MKKLIIKLLTNFELFGKFWKFSVRMFDYYKFWEIDMKRGRRQQEWTWEWTNVRSDAFYTVYFIWLLTFHCKYVAVWLWQTDSSYLNNCSISFDCHVVQILMTMSINNTNNFHILIHFFGFWSCNYIKFASSPR